MTIIIPEYRLGIKTVLLVLTQELADQLHNSNFNYIFPHENKLFLYPDNVEFEIGEHEVNRLKDCNEMDIFQIGMEGKMVQFLNLKSDDAVFMLTSHCNSNCIMCPATDSQRQINDGIKIEEYKEIVRYMSQYTEHITITGGEPFLVGDEIFELLNTMKQHFIDTRFLVLTNGRALAFKTYIEQFNESKPKLLMVGIPLHGYDSATHDKITRSPGGFKQTLLGIKNLLKTNNLVEIRIVVSKLNYKYITKIAQLIVNEIPDIYRVVIMGLEMLGNAAVNKEEVWIPYREAFQASKEAIDLLVGNSIAVALYNFPLCSIDKEYRLIAHKSISDYKVKYVEQCDRCKLKDACGGIFQGTMRLAGDEVIPVE